MKKLTAFFIVFVGCMLLRPQLSLYYASAGLSLWFQKMIPTLLPFMILSGLMVRLGLTEKIAMLIYPLIHPLFRVRKNVCYAMLMGFLCGFPMGARVVSDLYERSEISHREAEYLLAFCNNIGPIYFCSFALPLLGLENQSTPFLFGMYGIPVLYGLFLRYGKYRDLTPMSSGRSGDKNKYNLQSDTTYSHGVLRAASQNSNFMGEQVLAELDNSIHVALQSILMLGGYMVLFNLLNLLPHMILGQSNAMLAPLLEISGGLTLLGDSLPLYSLVVLSFGGLSCLAQTYSCISKTDLSIASYIVHKAILTTLCTLYYLLLFFFFRFL